MAHEDREKVWQPQSLWLEKFGFQLTFWRGRTLSSPLRETMFCRGEPCVRPRSEDQFKPGFRTDPDFVVSLKKI
jgi:hypothetical protein